MATPTLREAHGRPIGHSVLTGELSAQRPGASRPDLAASLNNLGGTLSELGRREEALAATAEAVELYRQLAAQRPDAFRPDLARSLGAHGSALAGSGHLAAARDAFREGIQVLTPLFLTLPAAHAQLMADLLREYQAQAQALGETPDADLISSILAKLAELK